MDNAGNASGAMSIEQYADGSRESTATVPSRFTVLDWLGFLFGERASIVKATDCPSALWVGLLFVLSAGFAREYDGAYFWLEFWHFILPVGASLLTSFVLFLLVATCVWAKGSNLNFLSGYRIVLTFFWLTAPLAWFYAIPVERFLSPAGATRANIYFLAAVSIWRVVLISRALAVWLNADFMAVLMVVLFFGDSVAIVGSLAMPAPIWDVMGGIRLPERESMILAMHHSVLVLGGIAWIILLIATCSVMFSRKSIWSAATDLTSKVKPAAPFYAWALFLLLLGACLLTFAQNEQEHRCEAERLLRSGQINAAIEYIGKFARSDFPPQWDPPPKTAYGEHEPPVIEILAAIEHVPSAAWLRDIYLEKLLTTGGGVSLALDRAKAGNPALLFEVLDFLQYDQHGGEWEFQVRAMLQMEKDLPPEVSERVNKFLKAWGPLWTQ